MTLDDILALGGFRWGGRWGLNQWRVDCLGLAIEARYRLCPDEPELPDFDWIYAKYERHTIPPNTIGKILQRHKQAHLTQNPQPGDLALIQGDRGMALGTFVGTYKAVDSGVLLFGLDERPCIEPDCQLPNLLSYWRVAP
jgi:hypothetical protein